jgi:hypothetical protein
MQVGASFIVQKVPADTPLAASTEVIAALHCVALHCAALHCTALHCTALHCNCDRSYSVPAASLSLRSGVTAQASNGASRYSACNARLPQYYSVPAVHRPCVCIVSSCAPWHTALCSQECMLHLPRRVLHCVRCALEVARWCRVPQAVCRFALCTVCLAARPLRSRECSSSKSMALWCPRCSLRRYVSTPLPSTKYSAEVLLDSCEALTQDCLR